MSETKLPETSDALPSSGSIMFKDIKKAIIDEIGQAGENKPLLEDLRVRFSLEINECVELLLPGEEGDLYALLPPPLVEEVE